MNLLIAAISLKKINAYFFFNIMHLIFKRAKQEAEQNHVLKGAPDLDHGYSILCENSCIILPVVLEELCQV